MADQQADKLLDEMIAEARTTYFHAYSPDQAGGAIVSRYLPADEAARKRILVYFGHKLVEFYKADKQLRYEKRIREQVILFVLRAALDELHTWNDEEIHSLISNWHSVMEEDYFWFSYPVEKIADQLLKKIGVSGLTEPLKESLKLARYPKHLNATKDRRKLNDRIDLVIQGQQELPVNRLDPLGGRIADFIGSIDDPEEKDGWTKLVECCYSIGDKSVPTKKWLGDAGQIMGRLDKTVFIGKMQEWLATAKATLAEAHRSKGYQRDVFSENIQELLKALIWCTAFANSQELLNDLDEYAALAYRKKPGVGPLSAKTGNACMYAFSLLPVKEGISKLVKFRTKIKNNTILKGIDRIIREVSEKNNVSWDELEELSVPDLGLDSQGELRVPIDGFVAVYSVKGTADAQLVWEKDGKAEKAVPASIKEGFGAQLKNIKHSIREIESLLPVYKEKIEQSFLRQRTWGYGQWAKHYLHHPLMGILAKKLIWYFSDAGTKTQGIWLNGEIVDVNEKVLHFDEGTEVQLWHPIGFGEDEIAAWRNFLQKHRITQPFKQAYREIYVVTDAELATDTYSNRFAAHILRQHQFAALCKQRGWKYRLMGAFDSHNTPYIALDNWNIRVEYLVDADWQGATSGAGIFSYISTDQVRFYRDNQRLQMMEVPALVFTETMRDIDLFVGVASIGNDPSWQDGGNATADTYWRDYSFGDLSESAKIRGEILRGLKIG